MGKFQRKYPDGAAEVIYRLKFEEGKTYQEAVHAASLGCYGVPAFTMSIGTAETYARKIKRQREGKELTRLAQGTPEEALEALRRRMVNLLDRDLERIEREGRKPGGTLDVDRIGKIARVRRELGEAITPRKPHDERGDDKGSEMSAEAKRILQAHKQGSRGRGKLRTAEAFEYQAGLVDEPLAGGVLTPDSVAA